MRDNNDQEFDYSSIESTDSDEENTYVVNPKKWKQIITEVGSLQWQHL